MSFEDLPDNWGDLPLDNSHLIADVLDLFVSMKVRYEGALMVLVCDERRRLLQSILVEEIELDPPPDTDVMVGNLVTAVLAACADSSILVALARPGPLRVGARDRAWIGYIAAACEDRLPLLGVHLATPRGSLPIADSRTA
jgi:hypothetical protein